MKHQRNIRHVTLRLLSATCCILLSINTAKGLEKVDGTTGIPMGGVGAGAVKFNAHGGYFAVAPASPAGGTGYANKGNMLFQFYSNRGGSIVTNSQLKSVQTNGRYDEDAFFPVLKSNMGSINGVDLNLVGFSPIHPTNLDKMSLPYAFFEIRASNPQATAVDVAAALQFDTPTMPIVVSGKGLRTSDEIEYAVYGKSSDASAVVTYGSDNGFFTSGQCNNTPSGTKNKVAIKVSLAAGQTKTFRFVLAWYNKSTVIPDRYYYVNKGTNAGAIADLGLADFDLLKGYATGIADKMRASNVPDWFKNQTMNSLANLANNWVYMKDGRVACAEGQFEWVGTMDQMWHARPSYIMVNPELIWKELQYWARNQKTSPEGQLHHDFGSYRGALAAYDDPQHTDYRNIDNWSDLNCGFVISVYEAFIATNDQTQLNYFWPYVKKAAQRIQNQLAPSMNTAYPHTFSGAHSSYDAGGSSDAYCTGLAITTFKIMSDLCAKQGDMALKAVYDTAFANSKNGFQNRWLNPAYGNFPYARLCESTLAGQHLGFYLKFDQFFPSSNLNYGISSCSEYYDLIYGLGYAAGSYNEWAQYLVLHHGGLLLQTGRLQEWSGMQYDFYERWYTNRDRVFNMTLGIPPVITTPNYASSNPTGSGQYISNPGLWRNYYEIVGFHRRKDTGELWVEPRIPAEMNHVLTNGMFMSPEGMGTISSTESGARFQNQSIKVTSESGMNVSRIYLKDTFGPNVSAVTVNGSAQTFTRVGSGYSRRISVNWSGTIGASGVTIVATGDAPGAPANQMAYDVIEAEDYTSMSGVLTQTTTDNGGGINVGWIENGDYLVYDGMDFSTGANALELRVSSASSGGTLTARLDSVTGPVVGTCIISSTGGWQNWETVSCSISGASGVHKLYLTFTGGSGYLFNINFFRFTRTPYPGKRFIATEVNQAEEFYTSTGESRSQLGSDVLDPWAVAFTQNGTYLCYDRVDFGSGVSSLDLRVASPTATGGVEIRLDSPTGPLIGTCAIGNTGGWQAWTTKTCAISGAAGVRKMYFVFTGPSTGYITNMNWFKFN